MSASKEKREDNVHFSWGKKRGAGAKGSQFYESFTYDGMEYFLYDSVFLYKDGVAAPFIGKLVKIWEQPVNKKRIKVLWFFYPSEVHKYLGLRDNAPATNELFLGSGEGAGLFNVNPLEALGGKCYVVCTSKDDRNRQPSLEELKMADFIFYRTFNVGACTISEKFENTIAGTEVGYLFNKKEQKFDAVTLMKAAGMFEYAIKDGSLKSSKDIHAKECKTIQQQPLPDGSKVTSSKKIRALVDTNELLDDSDTICPWKLQRLDSAKYSLAVANKPKEISKAKISKYSTWVDTIENLKLSERQSRLSYFSVKKETLIASVDLAEKTYGQPVEMTKKPDNDKRKWFSDIPWDAKIKNATDQGRLVLLDNLDPDYSQSEVQDIMYKAFHQNCSVRLIERSTFTDPNHGKALVIFKSFVAADNVVQKLKINILLLPNGRPLMASKCLTRPPGKKSSALIGLLSIDKFTKLKRNRDQSRKAASASRYSQPNTIEYEMAMEWMLLMHVSKRWWEELHKAHQSEMKEISKNLDIKNAKHRVSLASV